MPPLVSILIPAFNAEKWIPDTIQSALAQTWPRKEIIVVDDGSRDNTLSVARRFSSANVTVIAKENEGAAAARNRALALSQGQYIQWLDADDSLSPDKIELQLAALRDGDDPHTLLSSGWANFRNRPQRAKFVSTPLWCDLSPVEWLIRKMSANLHMQTATWLTSRELAEAAGRWEGRLSTDDDGEYFCRVLMACREIRFVPEARVYYRQRPTNRLSFIGTSNRSMDSMLLSMKIHIGYLRSLEDSERTRDACLTYIRNWWVSFSPERQDIFHELHVMANELGGRLDGDTVRWKYRWMVPLVGLSAAWRAQVVLPQMKARLLSIGERLADTVINMRCIA